MTSNKHEKTLEPSDKDLKQDPGIGRSVGQTGAKGEEPLEGDNTFEGDVENDTTPTGGVDPDQRGRTNK